MPGTMQINRIVGLAERVLEIGFYTALAKRPIRRGPRHTLEKEVIVSLTSHPPRFRTLHLSLRTLLNQSVSPDRLILWVAEDDIHLVPESVRTLKGVEVRASKDYRSYTKIITALEQFPDAYIVTADDDIYYPRDWLKNLLKTVSPGEGAIVCNKPYRFKVSGSTILPIADWVGSVRDHAALLPSRDLFITTGPGAVFPPKCLHQMVGNEKLFKKLAPYCDDTWLTWMAYRRGTPIKSSGAKYGSGCWVGTHTTSLWLHNQNQRMDRQVVAMSEYFGPLHRLKPPHEVEEGLIRNPPE